jgi:hypothetical protein
MYIHNMVKNNYPGAFLPKRPIFSKKYIQKLQNLT